MKVLDDLTVDDRHTFAASRSFVKRCDLPCSKIHFIRVGRKDRVGSFNLQRMDQRFAIHTPSPALLTLDAQTFCIPESIEDPVNADNPRSARGEKAGLNRCLECTSIPACRTTNVLSQIVRPKNEPVNSRMICD